MPTMAQRTHLLPAPLDEVWDVLADFGDISRWATTLDHSAPLDPRHGPGGARRIQVGRKTLVETVVGWEPPTRLSYRIDGLPPRLGTIVNEWRLEPDGEATRAAITTTVDTGPRPPHKLVERLVVRRMTRVSVELLSGLAVHVSSSGSSSGSRR
jgi:uncharacterized protein YndB with AHSA1/START domain